MTLLWIVAASLLGSVGSLLGAALLLVAPERTRRALVPLLVSYATGTLMGAALLGMLPASLHALPAGIVTRTVLGGLVLFFLLEKVVLWRHCHSEECRVHPRTAPLILIGDAFHNFVDGVAIAAAFAVSVPLGVSTTVAVVAHEVPQEIGDTAILLDGGMSPSRAFGLNLLSSLATLPGALVGYLFAGAGAAVPYILALAGASFLYIATADLVPGLHREPGVRQSLAQVALLALGVATVALTTQTH